MKITYWKVMMVLLGVIPLMLRAQPVLLPEPQQINYVDERFRFDKTTVRFDGKKEIEDGYVITALEQIIVKRNKPHFLQRNGGTLEVILKRTGDVDPLPTAMEKTGRDSREYYRLEVKGSKVEITSPSSAGLFYGVQTLRQLLATDEKGNYIPQVKIEDWPELPYRGFMMDMTHMQFPTIDEIKQQLDFLAQWKVNQYYFYSEANIELEGYPLLMPGARYTKEQIREITVYAKERFIDVVPNLNLYGHLHDFFKYEHYTHLSATPYGWEFRTDHPEVEGIVNDWIAQFSELFSSPFFHIGYDETYLIKYEAERLGVATDELYLKMLNRTIERVEQTGKKVMFYADRLQLFPEGIPKVEGNPIVVAWHYIPSKDKNYDEQLQPFDDHQLPLIVQGGVLNYRWLYPDTDVSFENNNLLMASARKFGAKGFIMSAWTDSWSSLIRQARPDMVHGAVVGWQKQPVEKEDFFYRYSHIQYPNSIAKLVYETHLYLSEAAAITKKHYRLTADSIWANPFSDHALSVYHTHKEEIKHARLLTEKAQIHIRAALQAGIDTATFDALLVGAKLLDYICTRHLYAGRVADLREEFEDRRDRRQFGAYYMETTNFFSSLSVDMHDMIVELKELFAKAWLNEYTAYRLAIPMARFDQELSNWLTAQKKLQRMNRGSGDEPLPPFSSLLDMDWD